MKANMDKQEKKPMYCSECKYLEHSSPEEKLWARCGATEERLNPFDLWYSTGIGKRCPYYQNVLKGDNDTLSQLE